MAQELSEAGVFRGAIIDYGLVDAASGAKAVALTASVHDVWDAASKSWVDWRSYDLVVSGRIWVVRKDGSLSQRDVEALAKFLDFTDFVEVATGAWSPGKCSFTVGEERYNDRMIYRLSMINDYERQPGMQSTVSADDAKKWSTQYGSQIRAIVGNARRNGAAPVGKPTVPAVAPKAPAPAAAAAPAAPVEPVTDEVPF
jgi:hypothetical protein